ncbi:hypothetical protein GUITHDRAFT_110154 [Guillardia theta CCMP2712]|uniref:Uncharacterized protein n=1 Tax=Guillardia theta (strain CCMP2712) TaxID=905079 RepID=L1J5T6_GUITC|nr:hypothetical protein GUITHDRAFT_110154 [Guillardia theta CCMP2712]EKX43697.1 hypothetical protein GUITHDRAFT_110154 [Guillardia theta CCMP2712]|eukprot:XP_005830677.1 hypothetical protein GUITHDRAFT_110154 [Guillardia theta CCMP2712]
MPFYLEGILEVKLEAVGFKPTVSSQEEEESEEQAQDPQGQQQGAGWLELSDIDRITMEAASPSGPVDQQVLLDLSTMLLETSEEELLAGKPISLELDKSVGKLHDTFCSPGNVEFMTLGAWAATPTLGSKRNMLKEKLRAYLGEQRWTRVQGNKKVTQAARRGSAFSPRAAATDALEQEAESDDIESRSVSLLFLAISKFAEHHGLSCTGKVDKQDRLRLMMREEVDMEAEPNQRRCVGNSAIIFLALLSLRSRRMIPDPSQIPGGERKGTGGSCEQEYDESVRNLLYRRSCQYTQGERSGGHVEEAADLVEKVKSFTKRYPNSRTAHACRAEGGCTPDAIAEAIRSTCRQARRDLFEDSLSAWSPESKAWFMQQMKEAKQQNVETYIGTEDTEETSFISMTLLGISRLDSVDRDDKAIMWKDISVTISFLRNEEAIALWQGSREYSIDGRIFRATEVSIAHDRSFKLRAKRGPWGKGGSLAELSQLLALGGMSTADIARIYQFQLISQCLAAAEVQPLAGMLVQGAGQRGRKGPSPKTYVAVGASSRESSSGESEAMEGVHLTLVSDDAKLRETFAVELTADTFVPRGKIAKQRKVLRDREQAPSGSFRVQIKSRSSMSTGRFSRKEMEALCGGGNTSTTRVKRAMLELARRMDLKLASIEVQEDRDTLSWDGSLITLSLATKAEARRLMDDMPFYLEGTLEVKLEAVGFKWSSQDEEESEEQAQEPQAEQQGAGWLELSDIDRITLEAASPSGPVDQQVLVDLSTMLLETSEEDLLAGKPISLELDKSVGKLHDTFYSPGNVEFMTLGAWAATPSLGSKRNILKEKLRAYLGKQRWTQVQGNKKQKQAARRGSAFSPRAAATDALEQEAESDDIESRSCVCDYYDESVRNLLYRRSCQYMQGERSGGHVEEAADLVERVRNFAKRYPGSRTAHACRAEGGCTPDAIAEAIRSTCRQARRDLFEDSLSAWSSESRAWFIQQMEEAKKQNVETYIGTEGTEGTSFISMTLLGISSMYVQSKLMELGLIVDSVDGVDKAIMWKAPYRPEIARADDISVTVSFLRNEAAMELWEGRREYAIASQARTLGQGREPCRAIAALSSRRNVDGRDRSNLSISAALAISCSRRVELTADTFVPRGKIAKQRRALRERDHAGRSSFRVQIKSRSSMSTGRFSRKEMEALCGGGNTSITRVKRAMLELARRIGVTPAEARRLIDDMPFYLEGILEVKLEAVGFKLSSQHEEERSPSSEEQAQEPQGQQQGAGWLELSDIDRITMEAASPSGPVDQQVLLDLSTMLLETSEEELLAGKPISLELDKSVGKLHDTFCSPGNVEFMTLGAWAATPTLGSKRNMLKEKLRAYLGEQRWTRVQGNKAARRGSAFSPRAAATDALEQESLLFLAISKFAEHHGLSCTGKVDKQDRLRLMMREEVDMEAEEGEGVEEEAGAGLSRA